MSAFASTFFTGRRLLQDKSCILFTVVAQSPFIAVSWQRNLLLGRRKIIQLTIPKNVKFRDGEEEWKGNYFLA